MERDFFAARMRTQLESFYCGADLPELTFPMKRWGGLRTALSISVVRGAEWAGNLYTICR